MAAIVDRKRFALVRFTPGVVGETGLWLRWANTGGIFWRPESHAWDFTSALDTEITPNMFTPEDSVSYACTHTSYIRNVENLVALLRLLGLKGEKIKYGFYG